MSESEDNCNNNKEQVNAPPNDNDGIKQPVKDIVSAVNWVSVSMMYILGMIVLFIGLSSLENKGLIMCLSYLSGYLIGWLNYSNYLPKWLEFLATNKHL